MDKSIKRSASAYIPPYWVMLAVGIGALVIMYLGTLWMTEPGMSLEWPTDIKSKFIIFCGVCITIESCFHWSIHKRFIMIHFLWIPVWVIPWEKLSHAEYIYSWSTGKKYGKMEGQGIMITLKGCPYFSPEIDGLNMFMLRHPFRTLFIRFTPKHQQRYVAIFKQYYPDLEFQIGYEENLKKGRQYVEQ